MSTTESLPPFGSIHQMVGFLRSCIASGEQLDAGDDARIDAAMAAFLDPRAHVAQATDPMKLTNMKHAGYPDGYYIEVDGTGNILATIPANLLVPIDYQPAQAPVMTQDEIYQTVLVNVLRLPPEDQRRLFERLTSTHAPALGELQATAETSTMSMGRHMCDSSPAQAPVVRLAWAFCEAFREWSDGDGSISAESMESACTHLEHALDKSGGEAQAPAEGRLPQIQDSHDIQFAQAIRDSLAGSLEDMDRILFGLRGEAPTLPPIPDLREVVDVIRKALEFYARRKLHGQDNWTEGGDSHGVTNEFDYHGDEADYPWEPAEKALALLATSIPKGESRPSLAVAEEAIQQGRELEFIRTCAETMRDVYGENEGVQIECRHILKTLDLMEKSSGDPPSWPAPDTDTISSMVADMQAMLTRNSTDYYAWRCAVQLWYNQLSLYQELAKEFGGKGEPPIFGIGSGDPLICINCGKGEWAHGPKQTCPEPKGEAPEPSDHWQQIEIDAAKWRALQIDKEIGWTKPEGEARPQAQGESQHVLESMDRGMAQAKRGEIHFPEEPMSSPSPQAVDMREAVAKKIFDGTTEGIDWDSIPEGFRARSRVVADRVLALLAASSSPPTKAPDPKFEVGDPVKIKVFRARVEGDGWVVQKGVVVNRKHIPAGPNFKRGGWWYRVRYTFGKSESFSLERHEEDIRTEAGPTREEGRSP